MAEVKIEITAKDNASPVFKSIQNSGASAFGALKSEAQNQSAGVKSAFDGILDHWKGIVASIGAYKLTGMFSDLVKESALLSARVETLGVVMNVVGRNAGYTSGQMTGFMEGVRSMGITTQESQQAVVRLAQANLDLGKASQLARVAQDAAVIGNVNSSEAMQRMIHGITTLQPEILRTIGITVDFEREYQKAALTMNKSTEALTQQEKQQIAFNAVLTQGQKIAGVYEEAMGKVGKKITSFPRLIEEAKLAFGGLFDATLSDAVDYLTGKLKDLNDKLKDLTASGQIEKWGEEFKNKLHEVKDLALLVGGVLGAIALVKFGTVAISVFDKITVAVAGLGAALAGIAASPIGAGLLAIMAGYAAYQAALPATYAAQEAEESRWQKVAKEAHKEALEIKAKIIEKQKIGNANLAEEVTLTKQVRDEYVKWGQTIEQMNPILNETEKHIAKLWDEYFKFVKGGVNKNEAQETLNKALGFVGEAQVREFDKMLQGLTVARQKAIDEAALAAGKMFTPPTGALAEVDNWLSEMRQKYKNNTDLITRLEQEAANKRMDVIRDWTVKRAEMEKSGLEKLKTGLETYRESLVRVYDETMQRADAYRQKAAEIGAFTAEWSKKIAGWGKPQKSQAEQIADDKKALDELIRSAWQSMDPTVMQQAVQDIGGFMDKWGGLTGFMGSSVIFPEALKTQVQDFIRHLDLIKSGYAQNAVPVENFANRQIEAIQSVDQWITYLQKQIQGLDALINQTKTMQIDVSQAVSNLDLVIGRITQINALMAGTIALAGQSAGMAFDAAPYAPVIFGGGDVGGGFASGTSYVPKTDRYLLHQGEIVLNPRESERAVRQSTGQKNIVNAPATFNIYGESDPAELARKAAVYMQRNLKTIDTRIRGMN